MPALPKKQPASPPGDVEYRGKQTRTGNSSGFRFEGALFKSHPEFKGEVKARVIAPGRMLVLAEAQTSEKKDPVMESFLAFLAQDMVNRPEEIRPLDEKLTKRIERLTKGVHVEPEEDLDSPALL